MAQIMLDGLDVRPGAEGGDGVGVAQIMDPEIWQAQGGLDGFDGVIKRSVGQVPAARVPENQISGNVVFDPLGGGETGCGLIFALLAEQGDRGGVR